MLTLVAPAGVAHSAVAPQTCTGELVVLDRDIPNADATVIGTVVMSVTERRRTHAGDPGFARVRGTDTVELHHLFVRVERVVSGNVNRSLVDVVDSQPGPCGIEARPGDETGVLLTRRGSLWTSSRYATTGADTMRGVPVRHVASRSFVADVVAGYVELMGVLAAPHDRPIVAT